MKVDFDDVGFAEIAVEAGGTLNIDTKYDRAFIEQTAVDAEVPLLEIRD